MHRITGIYISYYEKTPVGFGVNRNDYARVELDSPTIIAEYVRKSIACLLKYDRYGLSDIDCIRFDFDDDTSLVCESRYEEATYDKLIRAQVIEQHPYNPREQYLIDAATLRKQLMRAIPERKAA